MLSKGQGPWMFVPDAFLPSGKSLSTGSGTIKGRGPRWAIMNSLRSRPGRTQPTPSHRPERMHPLSWALESTHVGRCSTPAGGPHILFIRTPFPIVTGTFFPTVPFHSIIWAVSLYPLAIHSVAGPGFDGGRWFVHKTWPRIGSPLSKIWAEGKVRLIRTVLQVGWPWVIRRNLDAE